MEQSPEGTLRYNGFKNRCPGVTRRRGLDSPHPAYRVTALLLAYSTILHSLHGHALRHGAPIAI